MNAQPYRGLLHFASEHAAVFAGRERDIRACYDFLMKSTILILHGTTGCGKSSFLRAGLAPYARKKGVLGFAERNAQPLVITAGSDPLRKLAGALWELIEHADAKEAKLASGDLASYVSDVGGSPEKMVRSMGLLAESWPSGLILIIDQVEEIFKEADLRLQRDFPEQVQSFFIFLAQVSLGNTGVRLCLTLRTEYKGRLDDQLNRFGCDLSSIGGYYLADLDKEGMLEAIKLPAKRSDFAFNNGVPELIVEAIMTRSERILIGGRLPVLQLTCLRLWEVMQEEQRNRIAEHDLLLLVSPEFRIEHYIEQLLANSLHEVIFHDSPAEAHGLGEEVDKWRTVLMSLAREEPDGRVLRVWWPIEKFIELPKGVKCSGDGDSWHRILKLLGDKIIVFRNAPDGVQEERQISLAHDAVGLTLARWAKTALPSTAESDTISEAATFTQAGLFGDNQPSGYEVHTIADPIWDHQVHLFAQSMGFAERLGFSFRLAEEIKVDWRKRPRELLLELAQLGRDDQKSILYSLPPSMMDNIGTSGWVELLVLNLYHGFALIGPAALLAKSGDALKPYSELPQDPETHKSWLEELAEHLQTREVWALDEAGHDFFELLRKRMGFTPVLATPEEGVDILQHLHSGGFVIGSANERARAERAGFKVYLSGEDVRRRISEVENDELKRSELLAGTHVHNVWNVKPAAGMTNPREFRLRLASIGLYTCEYIRRFPDIFSRFLWSIQSSPGGRSERLDRSSIRDTVDRSYRWVPFEDSGYVYLDKVSPDSLPGAPAALTETHADLLDLRRLAAELASAIDAVPGSDQRADIRKLKRLAWRNYQIMNFYDAVRLLQQAADAIGLPKTASR